VWINPVEALGFMKPI